MKTYQFSDEGYCRLKIKGFNIELFDDTRELKSIESPKLLGLTSSGASHDEPNYVTNRATLVAEAYLCGESSPRTIKVPLKGRYWLGNPIGSDWLRGHYDDHNSN
jgi:hypothetical protein